MESFDLRLKAPFTAIVSGPSGSGKTQAVSKMIEMSSEICVPPPEEILYCYGVWQPAFDTMKNVQFYEGMIDVPNRIPMDRRHRWLIIDDLMEEATLKGQSNALFTKYSHHLNLSVLFLTQSLFRKEQRIMSLNPHYLFLFKNPGDTSAISHFARQVYSNNSRFMSDAYKDATTKPFSFLLIDMKQGTDERLRLLGNFLDSDAIVAYSAH